MTTENYPDTDKNSADLSYSELKDKIRERVNKHLPTEQELVQLAEKLEADLHLLDDICNQICHDLDTVSTDYIRKRLPERYKQKTKQRKTEESSSHSQFEIANNENKPLEVSINSNGKPTTYDEEVKQIYQSKPNPAPMVTDTVLRWMDIAKDKDLEIGRLREQLKEQKEQIQSLIKSVNNYNQLSTAKDKPKNDLQDNALATENYSLKERITELEQLVKDKMKQPDSGIGFQTATNMVGQRNGNEIVTTTTTTTTTSPEFPATLFSKFFIHTRNVKKSLFLKIKDNMVVDWEEGK